ncbi:MAG: N-acetylmuramoyl-L-alanine amidase [Bacteroidales bacterium]|nr:N-acetylmuramoyl-L-alanine amidase [Bacteroidales bacterium]
MKISQNIRKALPTAVLAVLAVVILPFALHAAEGTPSGAPANTLGLKTVCIDAGHGGHDPGCISKDKKTQEKALALSIATKLRDKIKAAYPDVKVIMTRSDDTFIALAERANIANKGGADLFISIHINSAANTSASGFSIHALGQSRDKNRDLFQNNLELAKRENSVITLEEDYSTTYQDYDPNDPQSLILFSLMQNANLEQSLEFADCVNTNLKKYGSITKSRGISQDPFLVLWRTTMPAVLIECGFMTNTSDLTAMRSDSGRGKIAEGIFKGFVEFKKRYDASMNVTSSAPKTTSAQEQPKTETSAAAAAPADGVLYGTQVLASGKKMESSDKFFKGYAPTAVWTGKLYKYVIGTSSDISEARKLNKEIKAKFPESFFVKIEGDNTERVK